MKIKIVITVSCILLLGCTQQQEDRTFYRFSRPSEDPSTKVFFEKIAKKEKNTITETEKIIQNLPSKSPIKNPLLINDFGANSTSSELNKQQENFHTGIDLISAIKDDNVYPTKNGIVVLAENQKDEGNVVVVRHTNGIETLYSNLEKCLVKVGDKVTTDSLIGVIGNSGNSIQKHLHYEIIIAGYPISPIKATQLSPSYPKLTEEEITNLIRIRNKYFQELKTFWDKWFVNEEKYFASYRISETKFGKTEVNVKYTNENVFVLIKRFDKNSTPDTEVISNCKFFNKQNWFCGKIVMEDGFLTSIGISPTAKIYFSN
jgi:murein DD-endopeptidase MepM/ murein hydrolase activator NlpD